MERDEVVALIAQAAAAIGDEMRKRIEEALKAGHERLEARLLIVDQVLAERHARALNAQAINDARFAALVAYLQGGDPQAAFIASREVFRDTHGQAFEPAAWGLEADWLSALRDTSG